MEVGGAAGVAVVPGFPTDCGAFWFPGGKLSRTRHNGVVVTRRELIQAVGLSGMATVAGVASASGQAGGKKRKFTKCLSCGAIGVGAG